LLALARLRNNSVGDRTANLESRSNLKVGMAVADDMLPDRYLNVSLPEKAAMEKQWHYKK